MSTFVFQPGLTWRKAGYVFFLDSLSYREVLKANPAWDITSTPSPGSILYKPVSSTSGGLSQPSPVTGNTITSDVTSPFYPFATQDGYAEAIVRYSSSALKDVERCNGWSSTSTPVVTGVQNQVG